jgi:hypothetical protein
MATRTVSIQRFQPEALRNPFFPRRMFTGAVDFDIANANFLMGQPLKNGATTISPAASKPIHVIGEKYGASPQAKNDPGLYLW